ncbi:outer membrane protein assembly factor BamD [Sulfurospirillum diekertiae]|uniref:Outer membrane protein assembly factor BamD n=1 Tax=Sulfurospirillum diekertiae TaxID=1854492 RepID=A0A6G9VTM6_9BACT|nr:outer membrane protein assembly factor BamD [Sulfurospirillum diekertiae]QIR76907.1 outer membrane protein assembly factor BamD [Sulfurospirillum diekertiae]QIR79525.1 outer membrane protein assembly factor BamD [Sulfurospirillum diekertiae]
MKIINVLIVASLVALISGCASKDKEVFNMPATYWYEEIAKEIKAQDLEKADSRYTSLASEHIESPLLPDAMMMLANAHIQDEEYVLANFYLDEYLKRYGSKANADHVRYMKIKANYEAFPNPNRNQQLLLDTIVQTKDFIAKYPNSKFRPLAETILARLEMGEYFLNENIKDLYNRVDKPDAAQLYDEKLKKSSLGDAKIIEPSVPWYRSWFEKK